MSVCLSDVCADLEMSSRQVGRPVGRQAGRLAICLSVLFDCLSVCLFVGFLVCLSHVCADFEMCTYVCLMCSLHAAVLRQEEAATISHGDAKGCSGDQCAAARPYILEEQLHELGLCGSTTSVQPFQKR